MSMDKWMGVWAGTPGTVEAAVMSLTSEEISTGLRLLSAIKGAVYEYATTHDIGAEEWDGARAEDILEAFVYADEHKRQNPPGQRVP